MDTQRRADNELLAIAHNANLSDGIIFPTEVDYKGRPIDAAWAETRMRNERLQEIKQVKGQSEMTPILSPNDDFANFEVLNYLRRDPAGLITSAAVTSAKPCATASGWSRRATIKPTNLASSVGPTRTILARRTGRRISSVGMRSVMAISSSA